MRAFCFGFQSIVLMYFGRTAGYRLSGPTVPGCICVCWWLGARVDLSASTTDAAPKERIHACRISNNEFRVPLCCAPAHVYGCADACVKVRAGRCQCG